MATSPSSMSRSLVLREETRPEAAKSVTFAMSPKSSQVLREHHRQQQLQQPASPSHSLSSASESPSPPPKERERDFSRNSRYDDFVPDTGSTRRRPGALRRRHSSDPTTHRHLLPAAHPRIYNGATTDSEDADSGDDVEVLPDRFDRQGRPFSPRDGRGLDRRLHARHGDFEYRPRHPGGWAMRGGWRIAGTDPEVVERMVGQVTDVIDGRGSWLGLLGDVIGGLQEGGSEGDGDSEVGDARTRRRRRREGRRTREPERLKFRDLLLRGS